MEDPVEYYHGTSLLSDLTGKNREQLETLVAELQLQVDMLTHTLKDEQAELDAKTKEAETAMRVVEFFFDTAAMSKMILEGR
jgi:hypothetical protein